MPLKLINDSDTQVNLVVDGKVAEIRVDPNGVDGVVYNFKILYHASVNRTWGNTFYHGIPIWQTPTDLWVYQELIYDQKPDLIIETGTGFGACGLYFAHIMDNLDIEGKILTIDTEAYKKPFHRRISYLKGKSIDHKILKKVAAEVKISNRAMFFLDSSHAMDYVYAEIKDYAQFVRPEEYLVVEDTNTKGCFVACMRFLDENKNFEADPACEKFYLTFNKFLRRVK